MNEGDSLVVGESTYRYSGVFSEILSNRFGCDSVITINLTIKENVPVNVGNSFLTKHSNIFIYPNPADKYIHIRIENITGKYRIKLISADGRLVYTKAGISYFESHIETIVTKGFSRGIYTLAIESMGFPVFKKIVLR